MNFLQYLQGFFEDLRREGIPVTTSQTRDCCQALLLIDWLNPDYFYTTLYSTLIKDYSYETAFNSVYYRYFASGLTMAAGKRDLPASFAAMPRGEAAAMAPDALPIQGMASLRGGLSQSLCNPLDETLSLASLEQVQKMEALFPLISRRLAAKMIKKNRRDDNSMINYRSTMRKSMSSGGLPLNIMTVRRRREKPVIVAICDVSGSVMTFSCFALAMLASMQRFMRQLRSFGFIEEVDEITPWLNSGDPLTLRTTVLRKARVISSRGYTNYGNTFTSFIKRYSGALNHKTTVLIFGDARNNWFNDEIQALQQIKALARKIYWFNPEPESSWGQGDSRMLVYARYCQAAFSCPTLNSLQEAIGKL